MHVCPGFGQDRVKFHQKPGGDTAGQAGPNWPDGTGCSMPCAVMLGSMGGELGRGGSWSWLRSTLGLGQKELLRAFHCLLCLFFLSVLLSLLFTSFAVLLNCPYADPRIFTFFSFHSAPHPSGGRADTATAWSFVAGHSQTKTMSINQCLENLLKLLSFMAL